MALILRTIKGEPLTIAEMDQNLMELDQRIKALEDLAQAEASIHIETRHDTLVFKNGIGEEIGRTTLPRWMPRPRGDWKVGETYAFGDWVRYDSKLYFCVRAHIAGEFNDEQWQLLMG
jgi:hypothetical protein